MDERYIHNWRARLKRRRGKTFNPIQIRELNLVAMMDMFTIILVFLLKSFSVSAVSIPVGEEMSVPMSTNIEVPGEAVKLTITKLLHSGDTAGVIAVDEEKVVTLDKKKLSELELQAKQRNFLIDEVHKKLVVKADSIQQIAKLNPAIRFDGKILVIADKETPYWLITQILYTAAEAQFEQYRLIALKAKAD